MYVQVRLLKRTVNRPSSPKFCAADKVGCRPTQPSSAALQRCSKKRPHPGCFFVMPPTTGAPSGTHRHQRFRCTRLSGPVTGVALVVLPFTTVVHPRTHCQQHLFVVWMYRRLLGRPPTSECRRDRLRATDRLCPARRPPTIPPTRERMSSLASSRVCSSWSAANNPSTRACGLLLPCLGGSAQAVPRRVQASAREAPIQLSNRI